MIGLLPDHSPLNLQPNTRHLPPERGDNPTKIMKSYSSTTTTKTASPAPATTATILLVDDEPEMLDILSQMLIAEGHKVLSTTSGEEAMAQTQKMAPGEIDLLISDLVMPKIGGLQLASWFRDKFPQAKILIISGYSDGMVFLEEKLSPSTSFLPKPLRSTAFKKRVAELLAG